MQGPFLSFFFLIRRNPQSGYSLIFSVLQQWKPLQNHL